MIKFDKLYIDGKWVKPHSDETMEVINPNDGGIAGIVPMGTKEDVDLAVKAATSALKSWSQTSVEERCEILQECSAALKESGDKFAQTITNEVGTPIGFSKMAMVGTPRVVFKSYAKILENFEFEEEIGNSLIVKEPVGVCGFITPWNFPLHQIVGKVAPALAAGCTMILKPSKVAPLNAFLLAEMMDNIGLPPGVFNLVHGHGTTVGEHIASHTQIDMLSFTGSTQAGIRVAKLAADSIKRVTLELGGKSANIILEDADVVKAVRNGVSACYTNSGQTCSALTRMLIPHKLRDEVIDIVKGSVERYTVGNPNDEGTKCGPMISKSQYDKVRGYIQSGIDEGATLIVGGLEHPEGLENGFFVKPTVFADVTNDMTIAKEEIFGPVLCIIGYENIDEAINIANDSEYGLSGGIWSGDVEKAKSIAKRIRTGQISINGGFFNIYAPFGGYKKSGNGRELGKYGLEEFLEIKSIQL